MTFTRMYAYTGAVLFRIRSNFLEMKPEKGEKYAKVVVAQIINTNNAPGEVRSKYVYTPDDIARVMTTFGVFKYTNPRWPEITSSRLISAVVADGGKRVGILKHQTGFLEHSGSTRRATPADFYDKWPKLRRTPFFDVMWDGDGVHTARILQWKNWADQKNNRAWNRSSIFVFLGQSKESFMEERRLHQLSLNEDGRKQLRLEAEAQRLRRMDIKTRIKELQRIAAERKKIADQKKKKLELEFLELEWREYLEDTPKADQLTKRLWSQRRHFKLLRRLGDEKTTMRLLEDEENKEEIERERIRKEQDRIAREDNTYVSDDEYDN